MRVTWGLVIDCARPAEPSRLRATALGYEPAPAPAGFASGEERDDGAYLAGPDGNEFRVA